MGGDRELLSTTGPGEGQPPTLPLLPHPAPSRTSHDVKYYPYSGAAHGTVPGTPFYLSPPESTRIPILIREKRVVKKKKDACVDVPEALCLGARRYGYPR